MYVETGHIDVDDGVAVRTHAKACNLFGHSYKQYYPAMAKHPVDPELTIWFPKLYPNPEWQNSLSEDGETLREVSKRNNAEHFNSFLKAYREGKDIFKRIVFAHERDSAGAVMYRFKGLYVIDGEASIRTGVVTCRRQAKRVRTYAPSK